MVLFNSVGRWTRLFSVPVFTFSLAVVSVPAFSQVGDVSAFGRSVPAWEAGVEGGIPSVPAVASVTDFGAVANDGVDDTDAFVLALSSLGGNTGAVSIPAGEFHLSATLQMPSGAVLRGAGADETTLTLNHSGHGFAVYGWGEGTSEATAANGYPTILSGAVTGSRTITLDDASGFEVGDGIELVQAYDPSVHETDPNWNQSWAKRLIGQFSEVTAKSGNQLTLSEAIRKDMDLNLGAWAAPVNYASQIGFEDFHVTRTDTSETYIFYVKRASNVWAKGIHSQYARKGHFYFSLSRRVEVRDCWIEYASDYGSGGHGYGVQILNRTIGALVVNNVFNHLRHSMMLHLGANGNVLAYNYSKDPYQDESAGWVPPDISLHGHYAYSNLIESNIVAEIGAGDYWGPIGPDNVMFRNQITDDDLHSDDHSNGQLAIGNHFLNGEIALHTSIDPDSWVMTGNVSDTEGNLDTTTPESANMPASFFYSEAPDFMADQAWPAVGADVTASSLPAKDTYDAGTLTATTDVVANVETTEPVTEPEPVASLSCVAVADSNWNDGNVVRVYLTNTSESAVVNEWTVSILFDDASAISSMWSATWMPGSPDQATGLSWNSELAPGEVASFGMVVSKGIAQADAVIPQITGELCH